MLALRILAASILVLLGSLPAYAEAGAIYYSAVDDSYGWCSGERNSSAADRCAQKECVDTGGADCQPLIACRSGWMAIASADDDSGIGVGCGVPEEWLARSGALAECMVRTHRRCSLDVTSSSRRSEVESDEANSDFALTWEVQIILSGLTDTDSGYRFDGVFGPRSRAALESFEAKHDLPPMELGNDLRDKLVNVVGGDGAVADWLADVWPKSRSYDTDRFASALAETPATPPPPQTATQTPSPKQSADGVAPEPKSVGMPVETPAAPAATDSASVGLKCSPDGPTLPVDRVDLPSDNPDNLESDLAALAEKGDANAFGFLCGEAQGAANSFKPDYQPSPKDAAMTQEQKDAVFSADINAIEAVGVLSEERGDIADAAAWWRIAADQTDEGDALTNFGRLTEATDPALALTYLERAANAGYGPAMAELGAFYDPESSDRAQSDMDKSIHWYHCAEKAGVKVDFRHSVQPDNSGLACPASAPAAQ